MYNIKKLRERTNNMFKWNQRNNLHATPANALIRIKRLSTMVYMASVFGVFMAVTTALNGMYLYALANCLVIGALNFLFEKFYTKQINKILKQI